MVYDQICLRLSKNGDGFAYTIHDHPLGSSSRNIGYLREVNFEEDKVYPLLKEGIQCKTHEAVLNFLLRLELEPESLNWCEFWHENSDEFPEHTFKKGIRNGDSHEDSIKEMNDFVLQRINETRSSSKLEILCKKIKIKFRFGR